MNWLISRALAQGTFQPGLPLGGDGCQGVAAGQYTFSCYFQSLINIGIYVAIGVSALIIVYAGMSYARSQGDAGKIALAKELVAGCLTGLLAR